MSNLSNNIGSKVRVRHRVPGARDVARVRDRYLAEVLAGDWEQASHQLDRVLDAGWPAGNIYLDVLGAALVEVGERWSRGEVSVAHEHRATEMIASELQQLRRQIKQERSLGLRAVVAAVEGERHVIGARMVADFLLIDGWDVDFLGADTPTDDLIRLVEERRPEVVALTASAFSVKPLKHAIARLRQTEAAPYVIVGGGAVQSGEIAATIGADAAPDDPLEAVSHLATVFGKGPRSTSLDGFLQDVGTRVRSLRRERGWSQRQLADAASLDRTHIIAIEHGRQNLTLAATKRLADALKVSVVSLLGGEQPA